MGIARHPRSHRHRYLTGDRTLPLQWLDLPASAGGPKPIRLDISLIAAPVCLVRRTDLPPIPMAEHLGEVIRRAGLDYGLRKDTAAA